MDIQEKNETSENKGISEGKQRIFLSVFCLFFFILISFCSRAIVAGQSSDQYLNLLSSGDEEQRLESVLQLGLLLTAEISPSNKEQILATLGDVLRRDSSSIVRAMAARALELSGDDRAAEPLVQALRKEKQVAVRKAIAFGLGRFRTPESLVALQNLLKDKKPEVRNTAAYSLAELADPTAAGDLIQFLGKRGKDEDAFGRRQAARGLGRMRAATARDALLRALTHDKSDDVRRASAVALGEIVTGPDNEVEEALNQALLSRDPYLVEAAETALAKILR